MGTENLNHSYLEILYYHLSFPPRIVKIGDNMQVESAKDIFFILEEYSKITDKGALVRFHCLVPPGDPSLSEEGVVNHMQEKRKSVIGE